MESDSDSEDEARVVKSAKDKHLEALDDHITKVKNGLRNKDWDKVQEGYKSLNDALEKVKKATGYIISFIFLFVYSSFSLFIFYYSFYIFYF